MTHSRAECRRCEGAKQVSACKAEGPVTADGGGRGCGGRDRRGLGFLHLGLDLLHQGHQPVGQRRQLHQWHDQHPGRLRLPIGPRLAQRDARHAMHDIRLDDAIAEIIDSGHHAIKLKVGYDSDQDARTVARVRARVPGHVELMVDANQAWSPDQAVDAIARLAPGGIAFFEEPLLATEDAGTWSELARRTGARLAAGENVPNDRVFRALTTAAALAKWLPPHGFTCTVHSLDVKVGGRFKMSFTNLTTGDGHSFGGEYLEVVPNEKLKYTDIFDDPNLPGTMQTTVTLKKVLVGTELTIVQEGIPAMIPPEACCLGWQESLMLLAKLVEAQIPG